MAANKINTIVTHSFVEIPGSPNLDWTDDAAVIAAFEAHRYDLERNEGGAPMGWWKEGLTADDVRFWFSKFDVKKK